MLKNIVGLSLFEEHRNIVSNYRILAQKYIDNGCHPKNFKIGKLKNEISLEYNRRIIIDLEDLIKKIDKKNVQNIKQTFKLKNKSILDFINETSTTNLDKLHKILLK